MKKTNKTACNKKNKYARYSALMMVIAIMIIVLINYAITSLDKKIDLSADMTAYRIYSLTSTTQNVLDNLESDIFIYTTETADIDDVNVAELLDNYLSASNKIHLSNIDIIKNPAAIEHYNALSNYSVSAGSIIISNSKDTTSSNQTYKILDYYDLYKSSSESETYDRFNAEDAITGAIKYIANPSNQNIWVLDNHNTTDTSIEIKNILADENYNVQMLNIINGQNPLQSGDIVLAISPESDLTQTEQSILTDFMADGGRMIIGIDPAINATTDLTLFLSLIEVYNISLGEGLILESDLDKVAVTSDSGYVYSFIIPEIVAHDITDDFLVGDYKVLLGMSVSAQILPQKINNNNITISTLLQTSSTSFIEPWTEGMDSEANDDAIYGVFPVMTAVTDSSEAPSNLEAKMLILTSPELFTYADTFSQNIYVNKDLLIKCISWLSIAPNDFYISSKPLVNSPLMIGTMSQAYLIIAIVCIAIPLLIFAIGIFIYIKRKNL